MTAFLTVDTSRARPASGIPRAPLRLIRVLAPARFPPRAVPTARWLIAPDGRLTCRWQTDK